MWTFQRPSAFFLATLVLTVSETLRGDEIFREQVRALLERRCLTCHNDGDRKGGFSLQTQRQLEDSGFVVPGRPDESHLLSVLTSHSPRGQRPAMPKGSSPLTAAEVRSDSAMDCCGRGMATGFPSQGADCRKL
jgi:hypothetical protein